MRSTRGGPGDYDARRQRIAHVQAPAAAGPLALLEVVLAYQQSRASLPAVREAAERAATSRAGGAEFPLVDVEGLVPVIVEEVAVAVRHVGASSAAPTPLAEAGADLLALDDAELTDLVAGWIDEPLAPDPRHAFWLRVAAGPLLELAAAAVEARLPEEWSGSACPVCAGAAQASVIAEESGEFMGGSPRSLVCGRCATWWRFPRAQCPWCGEDDSRRLAPFTAEGRHWARIDACETCSGYVKTFDLRGVDAGQVVPLVDDVATLSLDLWAGEQGFRRHVVSVAGV